MTEWTEAERFLLEQIRGGDAEAWGQFVARFQGRLIAFARSRGVRSADADDIVQDTFLLFLRGLPDFRAEATLETYLFVILRRQVIEHFRGSQRSLCKLTESLEAAGDAGLVRAAPDPSASWYVRRDEQRERHHAALAVALRQLADRLRDQLDFRGLQLLELLFYAQARNRDIAALLEVDEPHVSLQKHRWLKQLRRHVADQTGSAASPDPDPAASQSEVSDPDALDSLLTQVWQDQRPTCPKRSTIGAFVLGSLDAPWHQYVDFHLHRLGCAFCQANLEDLRKQQTQDAGVLRHRILQSTVGFLPQSRPASSRR